MSAVVEKLCQIKADGTRLYHCMTQNFIHCELKSDVELEPNQAVMVKILEPLADRIKKGGEIEAITKYIHTIY